MESSRVMLVIKVILLKFYVQILVPKLVTDLGGGKDYKIAGPSTFRIIGTFDALLRCLTLALLESRCKPIEYRGHLADQDACDAYLTTSVRI